MERQRSAGGRLVGEVHWRSRLCVIKAALMGGARQRKREVSPDGDEPQNNLPPPPTRPPSSSLGPLHPFVP